MIEGEQQLGARITLPEPELSPLQRIGRRLLFAVGLIVFVAMIAYLDREGYTDSSDGGVDLLDAFYYATVSVTTTGYGDITPVTDQARLLTTVLVTPARILFLVLLVGTTLELLAERTRDAYLIRRWRSRLKNHVIICGFGTKGKRALHSLTASGEQGEIVVIDTREDALADARAAGLAALHGDASRAEILADARVENARAVIVAPDRDDAAVLITLTARELNPRVTIVAAAREEENAHLLRQGGADSVITSSGAAGRLLGIAVDTPLLVDVLEDLLTVGEGLDIIERPVGEGELGGPPAGRPGELALAVVRGGEVIRFDDDRATRLAEGDRLICLCNRDE